MTSLKRISFILAVTVMAALATLTAAAQDSLGLPATDSSASLGIKSNEDEFLRVEDAYQVTITRTDDRQLNLTWKIAPGYYLYQKQFKFKADGQRLNDFEHSAGLQKYDPYFDEELEVHYGQVEVVLPDAPATPFVLQVTSQGCADAGLCYPPRKQDFTIDLSEGPFSEAADPGVASPSGSSGGSSSTDNAATETPFSASAWLTFMLLALAGGAILNLMPCVFPVLSIKAFSLSQSGSANGNLVQQGLAYTAGCVATFVAIAAVMLSLRAGGEAIGWGFQLQSPKVVTALLLLFFIMGLSFSGLLSFGNGFMGLGQAQTEGHGWQQSFMTGALASIVASPCTAPMMGAALGWAITQPSAIALSVFAALGLGMAVPFLALCLIPGLANKLPRPGPWMDNLKQALAFPMYASCVWLLWVLANQSDNNHVATVLLALVLLTFALWLWQKLPAAGKGLWLGRVSALGIITGALMLSMSYRQPGPDPLWEEYSPQRLAELRDNQQPVFVNLTAAWCITCLANERVALSTDTVRAAMAQANIQGLKGDWTNADPLITELLNRYGRSGVPLYLYYAPDEPAIVLPQLLTPEIVLTALKQGDTNPLTAR